MHLHHAGPVARPSTGRSRGRRRLIASVLALATVATGVAAPSADAGEVRRVWAMGQVLDPSPVGIGVKVHSAHFGTRATAVWVSGGTLFVAERSGESDAWGAAQNLGSATGAVDVDYGPDGTLGIAVAVQNSFDFGIKMFRKGPAAVGFTATGFELASASGAAIPALQLVMADGTVATVAWRRPGPTGSLVVGTSTGRNGDIKIVSQISSGPIGRIALIERNVLPPTLLWLGDTTKPGARLRAVTRGAGVNDWPIDASGAALLSPESYSVADFSAAGASDGSAAVAYVVADTDPVPGIHAVAGAKDGTWSTPSPIQGSSWMSAVPSVAAGPDGAAMITWRDDLPDTTTKGYVVDRASSAVDWPAATELVYLCVGCSDEPDGDPMVARGADGTGLVVWSGYGATAGVVTSFVGRGTSWSREGGLFSQDTNTAGEPLVLDDATTLVFGDVATFEGLTGYSLLVSEGRLRITGPAAAGPATMSGTVRVGGNVACTPPGFAPLPSATSYAWLRNGTPISGAAASTYAPVAADYRQVLQCRVTATIGGSLAGDTAVLSNASVVAIGRAPVAARGSVAVLGIHKVGVKQTCRLGTWSPTATYTRTVRWLRDGVVIANAKSTTYTPPLSMRGHKLQCRVSAARAGYTTGVATSAVVLIG